MQSVSPQAARKTWRTVEPCHGMIYFATEAAEAYSRLGVKGRMGYFGSRSAAFGPASAELVIATFYNFNPELVRAAVPEVWETTSPAALSAARLEGADGALRRMLGDAVESAEMARAADLVRAAAERAVERPQGRPLFAAHATLPWPDEPHLVLWHGQTLLREFRGDGHIAALLADGLGPVEALVVHAASGEVPAATLRLTRNWSEEVWNDTVEQLRSRGWLTEGDGVDGGLALTPLGLEHRQHVEDTTDQCSVFPYEALGEDACDELRQLARPWSRAIVAANFGAAGNSLPR